MEVNIWFYSFSTIAQVMASVAGLFAVFAVFRLDKLNNNISQFRGMALKAVRNPPIDGHIAFSMSDLDVLDSGRKFVASKEFINNSMSFSSESGSIYFGKNTLDLLEKLVKEKQSTLVKLRNVFFLSFGCISFSLFCLIFTDGLSSYWFPLAVIFAFSIVTLMYTGFSTFDLNAH
jgi:hypothetical protein